MEAICSSKTSVHFHRIHGAMSQQTQSRSSAVGIATGYGLDGRGIGVQVATGVIFSHLHVVQPDSGVHSPSYPMGTEDFSQG
jgi:hypothetical protein